jgi:hypothetical protein
MEQSSILFLLQYILRQSHYALDLDASAPQDCDSPFSTPTSCECPETTAMNGLDVYEDMQETDVQIQYQCR